MKRPSLKVTWSIVGLLFMIATASVALTLPQFAASTPMKQGQQPKDGGTAPHVAARLQPESPLRITVLSVEADEPLKPSIKLLLTNIGEQSIQAYTIRHDEATAGTKSSGVIVTNAASPESMFQPGQMKTEVINNIGYSQPLKKLVVAIDYVEFQDGTSWGEDTYKSKQRLAGNRAGAQAALDRLNSLAKKRGSRAVVEELNNFEVLPPSDQTEEWVQGYETGVKAIRERIRHSYQWNGLDSISDELRKPFDAVSSKLKRGDR
jgi:hypothetical protein